MWDDDPWGPQGLSPADERAAAAERDRQALCHLLVARGQQDTALIVAMSELRTENVHDYDGREYEVTLAVPPQAYDTANSEPVLAELNAGAAALVGADHLRNVTVELRRGDGEPGWSKEFAEAVLAEIRRANVTTTTVVEVLER